MDTAIAAKTVSDCGLKAQAGNDALLRQAKEQSTMRMLDDDCGCRQRNSPPLPDWRLIRSVADLEN
jgi:hypothetical protein